MSLELPYSTPFFPSFFWCGKLPKAKYTGQYTTNLQ
uniref:Uncharacterized protein n=1 Tax=Anguilla anguilla TaxID=7936 RepID=A0A0E9TJB9_ANGAN